MSQISEDEGISKARSMLGLDALVPARALRTRRADRIGESYYLVIFGEPQASVGVAAVDITTGEVMIHAEAQGSGPHLVIDAETAVKRAGLPEGTQSELVWQSCKGSRSLLYPLWKISYKKKTVYVDQQGGVWQSLVSNSRGG